MRSTRHNFDSDLESAIKDTKIIAKIIESGSTCLTCFESNPHVIEWHHVGGKKNSSLLVPLCANCHLLASKNQLSYDQIWLKSKPDSLKLLHVLKDLQFLEQKIIQWLVDELATDWNCCKSFCQTKAKKLFIHSRPNPYSYFCKSFDSGYWNYNWSIPESTIWIL